MYEVNYNRQTSCEQLFLLLCSIGRADIMTIM